MSRNKSRLERRRSISFQQPHVDLKSSTQDEDIAELTPTIPPDMYEYLHYMNLGKSMASVMGSLALAAGGERRRANLSKLFG